MAATRVTQGQKSAIGHLNQYDDIITGALAMAWHLLAASGEDITLQMSDAAGVRKVTFLDSAGVEVARIDSDGNLQIDGALTIGGGLTLPFAVTPTPTAEGAIAWDSDDHRIAVGDGFGTQLFYPGSPAREVIDVQELAATATSISFPNLSSTYKNFKLIFYLRTQGTATLSIRLNNDSGANYEYLLSSPGSSGTQTNGAAAIVFVSAANTGANEPSIGELLITKEAAFTGSVGGTTYLNGNNDDPTTSFVSGAWMNTVDAISRIDIVASVADTLKVGTRVVLLGERNS